MLKRYRLQRSRILLSSIFYFILSYVLGVLPVCMYAPRDCEGQERLLGPLQLELQMVVSFHAEN